MNKSRRFFLTVAAALSPALAIPAKLMANDEITIKQARAKLEQNFKVKMGLPTYRCQTGSKYVVFTAGGIRMEGEPAIGWVPTKAQAIQMWLDRCLQYAATRSGTLYWRQLPELEYREAEGKGMWEVYSRFVITPDPEVFQTVEDLMSSELYPVGKTVYNDSNTMFGV